MTHDYTNKGGIIHTEIMLPAHAPPEFQDRSSLWNSVEQIEKSSDAQLAREIEVALDLCIGVTGAVLVRLAVYMKGKNAKKYRHGMEYGSARWGGAKDIAPYIDPVFENNILLTQTERLTMNGRPKDPKTARNKNVLVIGGPGSGKTRFFVKPSLMQMHSSYCITDPKGSL